MMFAPAIPISKNLNKTASVCYHCGDECGSLPIYLNTETFCCNGCKTVFEILNSEGLHEYYAIQKSPGAKVLQIEADKQFAYLDNQDIQTQLLDFKNDTVSKITLFIPQIHCSSCIWLLENLNKLNKGIKKSEVNFTKKQVALTFDDEKISLKQVAVLLTSIGYSPLITLANKKQVTKTDKTLYYKIGVAGFCFGNIMLLTFPEYLGINESNLDGFKNFFLHLIFLLSLPVTFYCASGYLASAYNGLVNKHISIDVPISIGILVLFGRSTYEIFSQTGAGYFDSLAGLIFFMLIGKWYQSKIYGSLEFDRNYESYFPMAVTKVIGNEEKIVELKDLKIGDQLIIRNQELIPADAKLVKGSAKIDYSFVTGEAETSNKNIGDYLYSGGRQVGGSIVVEVLKKVNQSYLTQLWNQDAFTKEKSKYATLIDLVSKYFTITIIAISIIAAFYWYQTDSTQVFNVVTAILIIACPCALALTVPFTLGSTIRIFGKQGFFVKNVEVVEKLSSINTVVFDKTGTITQSNNFNIKFVGDPLTSDEKSKIKTLTGCSLHPLSKTITNSLEFVADFEVAEFEEIVGEGIQGFIDNDFIKMGSSSFIGLPITNNKTSVYISINNKVKGYFEFENSIRKGFSSLFFKLKAKYRLYLLSGDGSKELSKFEDYFISDHIHFNQTPIQKLSFIEELQTKQQQVLMVGDGLNDAGALKQSNLGIAVSDNVYAFSPACDGILAANSFSKLSNILKFSRVSMVLVKMGFGLSFLYNVVGISLAVSNLVNPLTAAILMPLSSVSIVLFGSLSSNILAKKYF